MMGRYNEEIEKIMNNNQLYIYYTGNSKYHIRFNMGEDSHGVRISEDFDGLTKCEEYGLSLCNYIKPMIFGFNYYDDILEIAEETTKNLKIINTSNFFDENNILRKRIIYHDNGNIASILHLDKNGLYHNEDGFAYQSFNQDGEINEEVYCFHGEHQLTEEEWKEKVSKVKR